jgi:ABC-type transport system substrate-binding protein
MHRARVRRSRKLALLLLFAPLRLIPRRKAQKPLPGMRWFHKRAQHLWRAANRIAHRVRDLSAPRAVLSLALALGACAKRTPTAPSDYLQVDVSSSPTTLDPRIASDAISARVDELVYESLAKTDRRGRFVGDLAQRIEHLSPTVIVFHLRRGARFSNGRQLTARDVVDTYESVRSPEMHSLKAAGLSELRSIRAADDFTVEMTTRRPYAPALEMATYGIVDGRSTPSDARRDLPPPGTGPFRIAYFARDETVVLERNPFRLYPKGSARGIVFKIVPDATVRALELAEGICDLAENDAVQPDLIPYLARDPGLRVGRSSGTTFQYLAFNFRDSRLKDLRVRRAIAYAINRDAIVDSMLRETARPATGMLTPEHWMYEPRVRRYRFDPGLAKRLLESAGYASHDRRLRFVYKTTPEGRRLAEALQAMLQQVGITIDIHTKEWATFYGDLQRGNFDLTGGQWLGINEPHQYYLLFDSKMVPPRGSNRGAYANRQMDSLVEAGDFTLEPLRRRAIYGAVQKLAADDLPYLPLWWVDTVFVMNHRIDGFEPYPNGSLISLAAARYRPSRATYRRSD